MKSERKGEELVLRRKQSPLSVFLFVTKKAVI
jgi:hypothetical protein